MTSSDRTLEKITLALTPGYRIDRELGAGGMATVYLAHDLKHDRDVAIKVLHPDLGASRHTFTFTLACALTLVVSACAPREKSAMSDSALKQFAVRYTAAWCSQQAASVAAHFAEQGSLKINAGAPAVGREAITGSAQAFMSAFPDMIVAMDSLIENGAHPVYHWTLTGTNTGPGGTGKAVRIHGYEEWTIGADGLIAASLGHYDEAEYARQLKEGVSAR